MNAVQQYQNYLEWLRAKYLEIAAERARFWQSARPFRINWELARKYGQMIHNITTEMNRARAELERAQAKRRQRGKWRRTRLYLKRVAAFLAG